MRRDPAGALLLFLVIVGFGGIVWMTRHPEAEILRKAEGWPIVGGLVESFRGQYSRRTELEVGADDLEVEWLQAEGAEPAVPSSTRTSTDWSRRVWVRTGTRLHGAAASGSEVLATVDGIASLPTLERQGEWYRVLYQRQLGWVRLPGYGEGDAPPLGMEPVAPKPLAGRPADPELLRMAIDLLSGEPRLSSLGKYELYTDHRDSGLLSQLELAVGSVEPAYRARYGLSAVDQPRETIVLYSEEADYRRLQNSLERVAGLPAAGLVSRGVVAIFVGQRRSEEIAATLVHELTHLVNRRALGPALPPWLDEGIADDLGYSAITEDGRLDPTRLAGSWRDIGPMRIWWCRAAALELQRALMNDRTVEIPRLLELDWRPFVDPGDSLHYPQSAFFVRFLAAPGGHLRAGFLSYLEGIAAGGPATPEELRVSLGQSWADVDSSFRAWLESALIEMTEDVTAPAESEKVAADAIR